MSVHNAEGQKVCLHEDRWKFLETRLDVGNAEMKTTREELQKLSARLFIGNGTPAFTVRLDRVERFLAGITYIGGAVIVAGTLYGFSVMFSHLWTVTQ
jgi:hypothetical protein